MTLPRAYAALWPSQRVVLTVLACGLLAWWGIVTVKIVHANRAMEARVCAAELRALAARNPRLAKWRMPAMPCEALSILAGGK